jgi:heme exporter protein A
MRLVVEDLACARGGQRLFQGLNFTLAAGEAARITGPNGSGKTSLLRIVAGLLAPSAGRIALQGAGEAASAESMHFVGHQDAIKNALTVEENLVFWRAVLGGGAGAAHDALARLELARLAGFPARVLSAGQRRRLALARLLVAPRRLWLLDEPAAALDIGGQKTLADMIDAHLAAGGIAAVTAHGAPELKGAREIRLGSQA